VEDSARASARRRSGRPTPARLDAGREDRRDHRALLGSPPAIGRSTLTGVSSRDRGRDRPRRLAVLARVGDRARCPSGGHRGPAASTGDRGRVRGGSPAGPCGSTGPTVPWPTCVGPAERSRRSPREDPPPEWRGRRRRVPCPREASPRLPVSWTSPVGGSEAGCAGWLQRGLHVAVVDATRAAFPQVRGLVGTASGTRTPNPLIPGPIPATHCARGTAGPRPPASADGACTPLVTPAPR
jgi:hypothetical protein